MLLYIVKFKINIDGGKDYYITTISYLYSLVFLHLKDN